jgi:orotate phosphoribosyltransferase-like protein
MLDSSQLFNSMVWDLRSEGLSISEISDRANLDAETVVQRLSFDAFNRYTLTESELEAAGLDLSVASRYGIEVDNEEYEDK